MKSPVQMPIEPGHCLWLNKIYVKSKLFNNDENHWTKFGSCQHNYDISAIGQSFLKNDGTLDWFDGSVQDVHALDQKIKALTYL